MFIDEAKINVVSGSGGNGVVHFRREKYIPFGGPDGGDGGKGGDVIIKVNDKLNTLSAFRRKSIFIAENGRSGGKQNMSGRSGKNFVVMVPPGTLVFDDETGFLLCDLIFPNQEFIVAKGGRGGRGNTHFKTSRNQVPRVAEKGEPGKERLLRLELKLIADVGIIGVPNAGKSTFLAAATNAKPKIAAYPFTTIEPNLGIAYLDDDNQIILADIPGLIEGAHRGVGLGHDFLRHIQRTHVLIHLINGLAEDPISDFTQINSELALFDIGLVDKPQIVVINKIDLPEVAEKIPDIQESFSRIGVDELFEISALNRKNLKTVLYKAAELLKTIPQNDREILVPVYQVENDPREFEIVKDQSGWRVKGLAIERSASMTYWEHHQSVRRFQKIFHTLGIDEELREAGIKDGDIVFIGDYELEWTE